MRDRVLGYTAWRSMHFNPAVKAAGLVDVTPHDLCASHATWVADKHGVLAAARRLGHSNASVTTGTTPEPSTDMTRISRMSRREAAAVRCDCVEDESCWTVTLCQ